jgi:hypothetical protein
MAHDVRVVNPQEGLVAKVDGVPKIEDLKFLYLPQSLLSAFIMALAYGVHNVEECFAIAGNLLSGTVTNALLLPWGSLCTAPSRASA